MKNLIIAAAAIAMLPAVASAQSANRYVNTDFATLSLVDYEDINAISIEGRVGITQQGKIEFQILNDNESNVDFTAYRIGYRHSLAPIEGFAVAVSAGAYDNDIDTDFYIGADGEMGVGANGVGHGLVRLIGGDIFIGGGYTHYFTPSIGVRAEAIFGEADSLSVGVAYAF